MSDLEPGAFVHLLQAALDEDHASEDVTTAALTTAALTTAAVTTAAAEPSVAEMIVKAPGVICGLPLVEPLFLLLDGGVSVESLAEDGEVVGAGTVVLRVRGPAGVLLQGERSALNFVQRLSGIATIVAAYVERTMATGAGVYDTRKTTPGWRALEKYAVRCGGGHNHRMHLGDAAMIKENHLVAAFGRTGVDAVAEAVRTLLKTLPAGTTLYVEVENLNELDAVLDAGGEELGRLVVMLDDFEIGDIRRAVRRTREIEGARPVLEATGGVTLERVEALASTGIQRISSGRLTHSAPALDISFKIRARE